MTINKERISGGHHHDQPRELRPRPHEPTFLRVATNVCALSRFVNFFSFRFKLVVVVVVIVVVVVVVVVGRGPEEGQPLTRPCAC